MNPEIKIRYNAVLDQWTVFADGRLVARVSTTEALWLAVQEACATVTEVALAA